MFGSKSKSSNANSQAGASINSSGWAVGTSSASGGSLEASSSMGGQLPKAAYISAGVVFLAWLYFKNKRKK